VASEPGDLSAEAEVRRCHDEIVGNADAIAAGLVPLTRSLINTGSLMISSGTTAAVGSTWMP
jgi:hypothetical protein